MTRALATFAVLSSLALLTACAGGSVSEGPKAAAFNPAEAEFVRKPGQATVKGQMFLRRNPNYTVDTTGPI